MKGSGRGPVERIIFQLLGATEEVRTVDIRKPILVEVYTKTTRMRFYLCHFVLM
jgi:hypothetical protein